MIDTSKKHILARAKNGVETPLYFDRQIIRAEDLTLDRTSHDRELARMRRILHGWGVVAGFVLTEAADDSFIVSSGYGITQTGDEVYLTEALIITNVLQRVNECCGSVEVGCEETCPEKIKVTAAAFETQVLTAWLVARPVQDNQSPRAGIAQDCSHPGNQLLPSRACEIVSIELLCCLPDHFQLAHAYADKTPRSFSYSDALAMLPMPAEPSAEDNFLVLGRVSVGSNGIYVSPEDRRTVLPVSVLQDWLQACKCRDSRNEQEPEPRPTPEPESESKPEPDKQPDGSQRVNLWGKNWQRVPKMSLSKFADVLIANGYRYENSPIKRDKAPRVPRLLGDPNILGLLENAQITTIRHLVSTDDATLAKILGVNSAEVERLVGEMQPLSKFLIGRGF